MIIHSNFICFKGIVKKQRVPEVPGSLDLIKNLAVNASVNVVQENPQIAILPAGSWVTGKNYVPGLSDHDLTILLPGNSYPKMEAQTSDIKSLLKANVLKALEFHKISQRIAQSEILPSINVFPPPQVKDVFPSYDAFRSLTNLKIGLNKGTDHDRGLWQMQGLLTEHFVNEGSLIYSEGDGAVRIMRIKGNEPQFWRILEQRNITMPKSSPFYNSQRLRVLSELIQRLEETGNIDKRAFHKYLERIRKFFFAENLVEDLFLVNQDTRKNRKARFKPLVKEELQFFEQFASISRLFKEFMKKNQPELSDRSTVKVVKEIKLFMEIAEKILQRPLLRGFM